MIYRLGYSVLERLQRSVNALRAPLEDEINNEE